MPTSGLSTERWTDAVPMSAQAMNARPRQRADGASGDHHSASTSMVRNQNVTGIVVAQKTKVVTWPAVVVMRPGENTEPTPITPKKRMTTQMARRSGRLSTGMADSM